MTSAVEVDETGTPSVPARGWPRWASWLVAIGLPTLLVAAHALVYGLWLVDDAGITFAYARSIAAGAGPVLQPGAPPVEGYSNPAWLALLVLGRWLGLFDHSTWFGVPDLVAYPKALAAPSPPSWQERRRLLPSGRRTARLSTSVRWTALLPRLAAGPGRGGRGGVGSRRPVDDPVRGAGAADPARVGRCGVRGAGPGLDAAVPVRDGGVAVGSADDDGGARGGAARVGAPRAATRRRPGRGGVAGVGRVVDG